MSIQYKNAGFNLTTTGTTSVLTAPTSGRCLVKQIQAHNGSVGNVNLATQVTDTSATETYRIDNASIAGAQGVLVNITGGENITLHEIDEATSIILEEAGESANIIVGAVIDKNMTEDIQVTVISTGFNTLDKNVRPIEKIEKTVPTSDLQNLVNKPLHAQKVDNSHNDNKQEKSEKLFFDDTKESPAIYENRLEVPAFLRKNQNR